MPEPLLVRIPLVNPNENEALIAHLPVRNGSQVHQGDLIAVLETTKATAEVTAEIDGYVIGLTAAAGMALHTGDPICWLAEKADAPVPALPKPETVAGIPSDRRITQPARLRAEALGVDLDQFPADALITVSDIEQAAAANSQLTQLEIADTSIVIYGGGGHARSLIDLIQAEGKWQIIGVVDDHLPPGTDLLGVPVLGAGVHLPGLVNKGLKFAINAVGGIGDIQSRLRVADRILAAGLTIPSVIHPRALVEKSAKLGTGCQVFAMAYVGSSVTTGSHVILNTGCIISHDCVLGDFVNISPGAILAGAVTIGARSLVGMGATINLGVNIGTGCRIGNGATVKADVPEGAIVRAGTIYPAKAE